MTYMAMLVLLKHAGAASACHIKAVTVTSSTCALSGYEDIVPVYRCQPGAAITYDATNITGTAIMYEWKVDGQPIAGETAAVFSHPLNTTGRHVVKAILHCPEEQQHSARAFPTIPFTVTALPAAGGSIRAASGLDDGMDCAEGDAGGSKCTERYEQNAESVKVVPDAGFVFTGGRVNNVLFGAEDFITMVSEDSGALVTLDPEFEPQLALQRVTFFGPDFINIVKDDGSSYPTPQWERSKEPTYAPSPVGYVRDSRMVVEVTLQADGAISDGTIYIKGDGPDGLEFPVVQDTLSGGAVTAELQSDILPDHVEFWDVSEFQVTWLYARSADGPWHEAGVSQNQLYVTLGLPKTWPVYHTLIHLGCKNAQGESSESVVVDKIWHEFTDRDVRRMDTEQLRYWHEDMAEARNTADLLLKMNGDCEAWASIFIDILKIQNIPANLYEVREKTHPSEYGFLVKETGLTQEPSSE